jgi:hypothetical protein
MSLRTGLGLKVMESVLRIGRAVAGIFSTAKGEDAIRAADIPPTKPALDRRRERLLAAASAAPEGMPKRLLPGGLLTTRVDTGSHGGSQKPATGTSWSRRGAQLRSAPHAYG